jgi:hypothetical protein
MGLVGSIILFVITQIADWGKYEAWQEPCEKLAEALFVAMVLALTVDMYLKKALTKDAVEAAIGYILPRYLQEEMAAIYSNEVVCIDHNQIVVLTELPNDLVHVRARVERVLENISTAKHTPPQSVFSTFLRCRKICSKMFQGHGRFFGSWRDRHRAPESQSDMINYCRFLGTIPPNRTNLPIKKPIFTKSLP